MATTYKDVDIKCPFFRELSNKGISCEGLTSDSIIKLCFSSPKGRDYHVRELCSHRYKNCAICKMLEAKYED